MDVAEVGLAAVAGRVNTNLRTTFEKIVRRAGQVAWPRLFQALRASCETDLMRDHPIHVVTAWIGNTPKIALGHDLQTLDADFETAIRGDATDDARDADGSQRGADRKRQSRRKPLGIVGFGGSCPVLP